ncbi:CBS domain-containing protein [Candidatus Oleimmundimicrobium sp.]|uniref:CBS domain-containing protein n=1 Tax=Candidatus Oleimmundimicrobium sp. TaxID=3060597 RepID=UPI0027199EE0|nr:CBS domain-containing protein [Candidatus Oleimmundimicrobium sp.]MDO8886274.1 CBS domain-containing protein [Candidatus Oleimmundimicrobium sp.]
MIVKDIMTKGAASIYPDATAKEAANVMKKKKVGSLLVVDDEELLGIITDRMIATEVVAVGLDIKKTKVRDFMHESVVSVSPEMEAAKAAKLLEELEIRYLPVTVNGKVVGMLSLSDIANFIRDFISCILIEVGARVTKRKEE